MREASEFEKTVLIRMGRPRSWPCGMVKRIERTWVPRQWLPSGVSRDFCRPRGGYSRLIGAHEKGTLDCLKAHHRELVGPKIEEHRGRIFNTTGDGVLAQFPSVADAVRCAVEIQRGYEDRSGGVRTTQEPLYSMLAAVGHGPTRRNRSVDFHTI